MALSQKVGTFALGTSSGALAVTGVGFTPALVFLWASYAGTADTDTGVGNFSFGVFSSTGQLATTSTITQSTASVDRYATSSAACFIKRDVANATRDVTYVSMDGDGFTVNRATAPSAACQINYLALAGTDLTNVAIGTFAEPSGTGAFDAVTSLGFQPTGLMLMSAWNTTTFTSTSPWSMGWTDGTSQSAQSFGGGLRTLFSNALLWSAGNNSGVPQSAGTFDSFLSNGFRLNKSTGSGTLGFGYVAIRGPSIKVGATTMRTDTSNQVVSGLSFAPSAVLAMMKGDVTANESGTHPLTMHPSFGGTDGTTTRAATFNYNVANTNAASRTASAALLQKLTRTGADTFVVDAELDMTSFNGDGFTLTQSDASSVNDLVSYIAFGPTAASSTFFRSYFITG